MSAPSPSESAGPAHRSLGAAARRLLRLPIAVWGDVSLRGAVRLCQRNAAVYTRIWKMTLAPNFLEPLLYLAAMGYGLGRYVDQMGDVPYVTYIGSGLVASAVMMGATFEGTYNVFVKMKFHKVYDAVRATPLNAEDIALGELLWAGTRSVIYGGAFLAVLAVLGIVASPGVLWLLPIFFVAGLLFASIAMSYTAVIPGIDFFNFYFTLFITPMFLFSGIFFPLDGWPAWARTLAWFTPLYHVVQVSRGFVLGWPLSSFVSHILWIFGAVALTLWIPIVLFRRRIVR